MELSFIILNYKTPNHLRLCVSNILKLNLKFEYEIIVVDNASHDGSVQMMHEQFPNIHVIENKTNVGHPKGNNIGFNEAQGTYIAMVNPDIVFKKAKDIDEILNYMNKNQDVAFIGPKLLNPDGTVQYSCYRKYSFWTPVYRRTFLGKLPFGKKDIARHLMSDFDHNETREVEWLLGACIFIRKKAMDEFGGMNEKFFLYFGDYEWCDRAIAADWKVVYFNDVQGIYHYHKRESASSRFSLVQTISYITRIHIKDWLTYLYI